VEALGEKLQRKSVWEWPEAKLLLGNRPQFGQAVRLNNQEPNDQGTKNHELGV
jgi:hypothetical protein